MTLAETNKMDIAHIPFIIKCRSCNSYDLDDTNCVITCKECGLVLDQQIDTDISNASYQEPIETKTTGNSGNGGGGSKGFNKIAKMQKWFEWSSEEKRIYKLHNDTRDLCKKLKINEHIIEDICNFVSNVMNKIKETEGSKRARVKDGIVIICICYVSRSIVHKNGISYNCLTLAKLLDLDFKYITKAEKILMEIMNCDQSNKLQIDSDIIYKDTGSIDFMKTITNKFDIKDSDIITKTKKLIHFCEEYDLLIDHTNLSVSICCFYYILKLNNETVNESNNQSETVASENVDIHIFTKMFNITIVTLKKIYKKLKKHELIINKYLEET